MRITDDPTPGDDAALLESVLAELRKLDREVVSELSTELVMGAARLSMAGAPEKGRAMHLAAKVLYAISHEVPKADA